MMQKIYFSLHISSSEYQRYYRGQSQQVIAIATDGRRIRFPARILQPFLEHQGIHGHFVLHLDENNKLQHLEKLHSDFV